MSRVREPHQSVGLVLYLVALTRSDRSVSVSIEQRIIIKFLVRENVKSAEIYHRPHGYFGEATFSWPRVKVWCNDFKAENVLRIKLVSVSTTNENIERS